MKNYLKILTLGAALLFSNAAFSMHQKMPLQNDSSPMQRKTTLKEKIISAKCKKIHQNMRQLWLEHEIWVRQYIVSTLADLPDASAVTEKVLKNQEDLGNSIAPYYGDKAASELTNLLKQHILIATEVVKAAKMHNEEALKEANTKWQANAKAIADFFSNNNEYWKKAKMEKMLNNHLAAITKEVTLRLNKNWKEDINNFDEILKGSTEMGDTIAHGIMLKFMPECK